ncbi:MAG: hypothetical protein M9921_14555 [Fimbriimonadaceae bacterium]|nr:PD40 domain-containing protein [Chthonomonadaceae bacterium]MCO5298066.1 hypothetical protein [Fimbriimonadaceae bacterium]
MIKKCVVIACLSALGTHACAVGFIVGAKRVGGIINLSRMNLDGSGEIPLTAFGTNAYGPSISPDGSKIAFHSWHTGRAQIFVMDSDGSNMHQLTFDAEDNLFPSWSPDGSQLLFQRGTDTVMDLFLMNADGSNQVNITNTPNTPEGTADWSRANGRIAFTRGVNGTGDVWTMESDGSGLTQLTTGGWDEWAPRWSQDGTQIAFHALDGGSDWRGWMMGADGSNQHVFTQLLGSHAYPDYWDSGRILVHGVAAGANPDGLFWLSPDGNDLQLIHEGLYVGATAWTSAPVPEPCSMILGALALTMAARRSRSRNRRA